MTIHKSARNTAIDLPTPLERLAANRTIFRLIMSGALVIMSYRTRATAHRAPGSWCAAVPAVLGILARGGEFAPVQILVTGNTKRNSVVYVEYQFGIVRNWLYMMGVNVSANIAALLAGVIVSLVNSYPPFSKIAFRLGTLAKQGFAALPYRRSFTRSPFQHAIIRTDRRAVVDGIKQFTANPTGFIKRLASLRPARFRTILGTIGAVCLDFVGITANCADLDDLNVFHSVIITHSTTFTPYHCAIQRWVDMTGKEPELVE